MPTEGAGLLPARVRYRHVKRPAQCRIIHLRARGVDGGELIQQLHVATGGDIDVARAGADDLVTRRDGVRGRSVRARRPEDINPVILAQKQRSGIGRECRERLARDGNLPR